MGTIFYRLKKRVFGIFVLVVFFSGFLVFTKVASCKKVEINSTIVDKVKISFKSNYDPLPVEYAKFNLWSANSVIENEKMLPDDGYFIIEIPIKQNVEYTFNIETNNIPGCGRSVGNFYFIR